MRSPVHPPNPQSWNRYAYVLNNPLALTDPTGKAAGLRPEYYEYNIDVLFMSGDVIGAAEAVGGGGTIAGCDEFDLIAPNSFCNQIVFPILTQTFNVQDWTNYYATKGYSDDPCIFVTKDSNGVYTGSVNATLDQKGCQKAGGTWVAPGLHWIVNGSTGAVVSGLPSPPWQGPSYGAYLGCVGEHDLGTLHGGGLINVAPLIAAGRGQPLYAISLFVLAVTYDYTTGMNIRQTCTCQVYGRACP